MLLSQVGTSQGITSVSTRKFCFLLRQYSPCRELVENLCANTHFSSHTRREISQSHVDALAQGNIKTGAPIVVLQDYVPPAVSDVEA